MQYALLIYDDDSSWVDLPDDERARLRAEEMPRWTALFAELGKADPSVSGHELDSRATAKVVQVRDGARLPDLDEAIRLSALIPAAEGSGAVEIRPVVSRPVE
jgi:hypothetical protein